ncbi:MAG TPA: nucleotidyltransferase family protein [Streptosporangiaceae bacterium]
MRIGRLPVDEQLRAFRSALERNDLLAEVLTRASRLNLPDWYLASGCLYQTVWNVVTGRPPGEGIEDYDLIYFDQADLSWEAEDAAILAGQRVFGDLPAPVQIRNQARVHLWYERKFGVPSAPHDSAESAIDTFPATVCCLGVRIEGNRSWRVYAPYGLSDVFNLVVRPNTVQVTRDVYEAKASRWRRQWPGLTVHPWPDHIGGARGPSPGRT